MLEAHPWRCIGRQEVFDPFRRTKRLVRCGRCLACVEFQRACWRTRLVFEAKCCPVTLFVTLTYNNEHVPRGLPYEHVQAYLKRVRERYGPLRFFCVGEYGAKRGRPHWHLLQFHSEPSVALWKPSADVWPYGFSDFSLAGSGSFRYVAGYVNKANARGEPGIRQMSRRPGLGRNFIPWLVEHFRSVVPEVERVPAAVRIGGDLCPLDRTVRRWFQAEYLRQGGRLTGGEPHWLLYDLEARLVLRFGDPQRDPVETQRMMHLDRRQLEASVW